MLNTDLAGGDQLWLSIAAPGDTTGRVYVDDFRFVLVETAIPEPGSGVLLAIGSALVMTRERRKA